MIVNGILFDFYGDDIYPEIPEGVTTIGYQAFKYWDDLMCVTIPLSVKRIGDQAFLGCHGLKELRYAGSAEQWAAVEIGENGVPSDVPILFGA